MRGTLKKNGHYELFETVNGHQILNLDNKEYYALIEGQQGDIIVHSSADHEKKQTQESGNFYLAEFKNDPEFQDIPHLFLESNKKYRELLLPNGLPTNKDHQKKLIRTEEEIPQRKVKEHVEGKGDTGSEKQYQNKAEGLKTKSKDELYKMAKKEDIKGHSQMRKEELVDHLKE